MSLAARIGSLTPVSILAPIDAADTAAASSGWIDCRGYEGDIAIIFHAGVLDGGSVTWTAEHATDGSGTGNTAITFNEGAVTQVTTSNDAPNIQIRSFPARSIGGWIKTIGTVVTGGALVATSLIGIKKYTA